MAAAGTCQARDRFELAITRCSVQKEICDEDLKHFRKSFTQFALSMGFKLSSLTCLRGSLIQTNLLFVMVYHYSNGRCCENAVIK